MTSKQEAKMSMYDAVVKHCNDNPAIVATIPAFLTASAALASQYSSLVSTAQLEMSEISGIAIDKSLARKNLAQQGVDISGAIFAFASASSNNDLKEKARNPISKLLALRDELLAPACQNIHNLANTNIASLGIYGITAATLTSFQDAIDSYANVIPSPRNAVSQRASHAATIKELFKQADDILKDQMDKIALQFKSSNLQFYNSYKSNRIILDAGVSTTRVSGTVTTAVGNTPIQGAVITVVDTAFTITSDAAGFYELPVPVPGTYSISCVHPTLGEFLQKNVTITLGANTNVNFSLIS